MPAVWARSSGISGADSSVINFVLLLQNLFCGFFSPFPSKYMETISYIVVFVLNFLCILCFYMEKLIALLSAARSLEKKRVKKRFLFNQICHMRTHVCPFLLKDFFTYLFETYLLIYLKGRAGERMRKIFHLLVHFPEGSNSQAWARRKLELGIPFGSLV